MDKVCIFSLKFFIWEATQKFIGNNLSTSQSKEVKFVYL